MIPRNRTPWRISLSVTALAWVAICGPAVAQPPAEPPAVLRCGRMLNVRTGAVEVNALIVVSNGRIAASGAAAVAPPNARVIDLSNSTCLPGLIDVHTHLLQNYSGRLGGDDPNMALTVATLGTTRRALLGAAMGREDLEAGITTVRDLGNSGWNGDVALRDAIRSGWVVGPRIVASTRALSAAGGQFGGLAPEAQKLIENEYVVISGVEEARKAVRQALYDGADVIKVIVNTGPRVVPLEEMKVIVDEAARVGRKVAAHAIGDLATRIAAEAGVASIEHAYTVPDDVLAMMARKSIFLVPTDYPAEDYLTFGGDASMTPEQRKQAEQGAQSFAEASRARTQRAIKAGVRIAFGSDEYYQFPNSTRGQSSLHTLRTYANAGMSPLDVIRTATMNAAELLGMESRIGGLETGKFADVIAVPGDPLTDVRLLERVSFVMKNGKVVRQ